MNKRINTKIRKKDLDNILFQMYHFWSRSTPQNQYTISTYLEGFDAAKSPNFDIKKSHDSTYRTCISLFSTFIYQKYQIKHINWQRQIDTYAYKHNLGWNEAFFKLFGQFARDFPKNIEDIDDECKMAASPYLEYEVINPTLNQLDSIVINNLKIIKGTILQLTDRIGEDYKQTIHYDISVKEPSWDLYDASDKDYQFVRLCHIKDHFKRKFDFEIADSVVINRLRRICSGFTSEVRYICEKAGKYFVYTDHFEIELQRAFDNKEIEIVQTRRQIDEVWDEYFINHFHNAIRIYAFGMITANDLFDEIYQHLINTKCLDWVNYYFTFSGWLRKSDNSLVTEY
jgi:hypothetical protein